MSEIEEKKIDGIYKISISCNFYVLIYIEDT